MADRVIAFERELSGESIIVATARQLALFSPAADSPAQYSWEDTSIRLPSTFGTAVDDVLTGREIPIAGGAVSARELFSILPAAVLVERRSALVAA